MVTVTKAMLCLIHLHIFKTIYPSLTCLGDFFIYIYGELFILTLHLNYICVCINIFGYPINGIYTDMFVHILIMSVFYFCASYKIELMVVTHVGNFVLCLSYVWVILPLYFR